MKYNWQLQFDTDKFNLDKFEAFKTSWNDYPSQDNEGWLPDRGSFKAGFFSGASWAKDYISKKNTTKKNIKFMIIILWLPVSIPLIILGGLFRCMFSSLKYGWIQTNIILKRLGE